MYQILCKDCKCLLLNLTILLMNYHKPSFFQYHKSFHYLLLHESVREHQYSDVLLGHMSNNYLEEVCNLILLNLSSFLLNYHKTMFHHVLLYNIPYLHDQQELLLLLLEYEFLLMKISICLIQDYNSMFLLDKYENMYFYHHDIQNFQDGKMH